MLRIDSKTSTVPYFHRMMLGAVAPRPIAFASTIDKNGNPNLSPFSFFNAFGANPPTLIFSPSRRGRDNTTKHTFENVKEVPEVVINVVTYSIMQQMNLASTEYPEGVNEFTKAGFTAIPSEKIKPFRVKESPVQFECKVKQIIETGDQGAAGNLIICEILLMHLDENILDESGMIDPNKIDLIGRMGGDYYCRASGNALFKLKKPSGPLGIGIDQLPEFIRFSPYLSGNDLGKLGSIATLPDQKELETFKSEDLVGEIIAKADDKDELEKQVHYYAKELLNQDKVGEAMKALMSYRTKN